MKKYNVTVDIFKKTIYYAKDKDGNVYTLDTNFVEEVYASEVKGETETTEIQDRYYDGSYARSATVHNVFHPETKQFFWQLNKK